MALKRKHLIPGIILLVLLSGLATGFRGVIDGGMTLFDIEHDEVVNYNFDDITDSCNMHVDINLSDPNYCSAGEKEAFVSYTKMTNWSMLCCEFSSQCKADSYTNRENICENEPNGTYTGYLYNNNNMWLAYCCNDQGDNCYVDTSVSPNDNSTVCDQEYTFNTMSLNWNTSWDATCCAGGID